MSTDLKDWVFQNDDDYKQIPDDRYEYRTHMPFVGKAGQDGITGKIPDTPDSQGKNDNIRPRKYSNVDNTILFSKELLQT